MMIGGAEDKFEQKFILRSFFDLAGGKRARIIILPSASEHTDSGAVYHQIFSDFGARSVQVIPLFNSEEANLPEVARDLAASTGVFMTGGDQSKIVHVLQGSASLMAIMSVFDNGAVIAGTSAGAAALCDPMIASGSRGSLPRSGMVKIGQGLGLTRSLLIDQHFRQRDRLGRLLTAIMSFPDKLGVGVDEDTAAIVVDGHLEVVGRGTVTIVDSSHLHSNHLGTTPDQSPLAFSHLVLHTLVHGGRFDLVRRTVVPEES
jgi:cyanophycinase